MSGLANRLVAAAVKAQQDGLGVEEKARLSVAAVLRTMAESGQVAWAESLAGLAEVIEKGEQRMSDDLIGKLVRWEHERGQWFTARVTGGDGGSGRGSLSGEVVDPGNYIGVSEFAPKQALQVGAELPNLRPELLTVIDDEVSDVE